jgi:hypothetical protein
MDPKSIDDEYVARAAHGIGLELAPSHVPGVVRYFQMIAGMADSVAGLPLDDTIEPAAIFRPCPAPTQD